MLAFYNANQLVFLDTVVLTAISTFTMVIASGPQISIKKTNQSKQIYIAPYVASESEAVFDNCRNSCTSTGRLSHVASNQ